MTSPTSPTPAGGPAPGSPQSAIPVRSLTCWALLALAGAIIFFGFLSWIFPASPTDFIDRFGAGTFTSIPVVVAPLLAVLVATKLGSPLPQAKLAGTVALIEYVTALLLGALAFLITLASEFDGLADGFYAFGGILQAIGDILINLLWLGLLALAALWTYRIFTSVGGALPQLNIQTD